MVVCYSNCCAKLLTYLLPYKDEELHFIRELVFSSDNLFIFAVLIATVDSFLIDIEKNTCIVTNAVFTIWFHNKLKEVLLNYVVKSSSDCVNLCINAIFTTHRWIIGIQFRSYGIVCISEPHTSSKLCCWYRHNSRLL